MTVRPPARFSAARDLEPTALEHEVLGEKAASLGRSGRRVEETLAALAACPKDDAARPPLLRDAVETVYYYLIQRELCGLRDHRPVIDHYQIPAEVLSRLGAT